MEFTSRNFSLSSGVKGVIPSSVMTCLQRASKTSGAPLVKAIIVSCILWKVVIIFRSESKGISLTRLYLASASSLVTPALTPATTKAPSVGSPIIWYPLSVCSSLASLFSRPPKSISSETLSCMGLISCSSSVKKSPTGL